MRVVLKIKTVILLFYTASLLFKWKHELRPPLKFILLLLPSRVTMSLFKGAQVAGLLIVLFLFT